MCLTRKKEDISSNYNPMENSLKWKSCNKQSLGLPPVYTRKVDICLPYTLRKTKR